MLGENNDKPDKWSILDVIWPTHMSDMKYNMLWSTSKDVITDRMIANSHVMAFTWNINKITIAI